MIVDRNASSDYARFSPAPGGLKNIDASLVFAQYWTHPGEPIMEFEHGSIINAEVLVPDRVDPRFIAGAYVANQPAKDTLETTGAGIQITVNSHLFFDFV